EGGGAGLTGAGGQSGEQLGVHGDGWVGLEPQSVVGVVADGNAGALGRASSPGKRHGVADGVQDLHQCLYVFSLPDCSRWPPLDLSAVELESVAKNLFPRTGPVTLLTRPVEAGVRMLRSATAFWGRRQIERLLMAKQEKQQAGRRDSLRRADGRGDPADRS